VGVRSDGTVVAVGYNNRGQCNVRMWTNIIQVAAGGRHTVGLESDGTVVAVGANWAGQCNVDNWSNIIQVAAGDYHTVGVRSNGTMVAVGWNDFAQCVVGSRDLNLTSPIPSLLWDGVWERVTSKEKAHRVYPRPDRGRVKSGDNLLTRIPKMLDCVTSSSSTQV